MKGIILVEMSIKLKKTENIFGLFSLISKIFLILKEIKQYNTLQINN